MRERDSKCHGYLAGCYSLEARVEPGGWCPLAGGNPESSAPLGACRQEGESLHQEGGKNKEQRGELLLSTEEKEDKCNKSSQLYLTWHLEWTAGVRAGW